MCFSATRLKVSDNYFRPRWVGLGERRLKNVTFVLEVDPAAMPCFQPQAHTSGSAAESAAAAAAAALRGTPPSLDPGALIGAAHGALVALGRDSSGAAAEALQLVRTRPPALCILIFF